LFTHTHTHVIEYFYVYCHFSKIANLKKLFQIDHYINRVSKNNNIIPGKTRSLKKSQLNKSSVSLSRNEEPLSNRSKRKKERKTERKKVFFLFHFQRLVRRPSFVTVFRDEKHSQQQNLNRFPLSFSFSISLSLFLFLYFSFFYRLQTHTRTHTNMNTLRLFTYTHAYTLFPPTRPQTLSCTLYIYKTHTHTHLYASLFSILHSSSHTRLYLLYVFL
jgi:hypothetical protein